MTTSFCSISTPDFLDLQVAIFGSDTILALALKTDGGQHPPTHHLAAAWAHTIQYFSEQVRITGKPLSSFVQNTGAWEHRWTWSRPGNNNGEAGGNRETDLPREIVSEMRRLREEARLNQAANDRLKAELRSYGLSDTGRSDKIKGKGGDKGKGKNNKGKNQNGKGDRLSRSRDNRDRRDRT